MLLISADKTVLGAPYVEGGKACGQGFKPPCAMPGTKGEKEIERGEERQRERGASICREGCPRVQFGLRPGLDRLGGYRDFWSKFNKENMLWSWILKV